jgi:hypothetical protein
MAKESPLVKSYVPRTVQMDYRDNLAKMERAFRQAEQDPPPPPPLSKKAQKAAIRKVVDVDTHVANAAVFHRVAKKTGSTVIITSLCEIDRLIEDKKNPQPEPAPESADDAIRRHLPPKFHDLINVFRK